MPALIINRLNMKHGLYLLFSLLCCTGLQAQEHVVEQPAFDAWNSTTLEIDKIVLSDTATVFYIDAYYRPKYWIQVAKETTLQADGKTYPIKTGDGINLSEKFWMPESGTASFRLIFPPLPKGTKTVDFSEGDVEGAYKIWNIRLDGSPAYSSLAGKKNPVETPVLETPVLRSGIATLKGKIADYQPGIGPDGMIWSHNTLAGGYDEYNFKIQPDGTFMQEIPLLHATCVNINAGFIRGKVYLKPGETTSVEINLPEICRIQSKKQKDKPSLGEKFFFTGAFAALNNEVNNHPVTTTDFSPRSQEEYMKMMSDVSNMNLEEFKKYWLNRYHEAKEKLDGQTGLSEAYHTLLLQDLKHNFTMQAMSTSMIEYAYRNVNKIPRDSTLTDYVKQVPTFEYYDFIPQYISNSPMELYGSSYASLLDVLRYTNFSGAERIIKDNQVPDNTAEVTKVMGTDKGILFDLLAGRRLAGSIKEFKPLSNEELCLVDKTAPDIRATLLDMNDKLKQTIEENKKKSGYTVNRVNIADVPAEELFNAIITPYRGKVVFVDFWATWCGPCKAAMKQSEPVKKDFAGKEIVFLYLAGENSPKGTWEQMIPDIKGEHYRVTDAQWNFICKKFGVNGVPSYMIIAKDGTPTHFQVGFMGAEKMKEMLMKELDK